MTTLNSRLQLAMLNRKKSRNLLEKGFTLVELMIVIVIVGVLSAVALPNFLSQTQKAKASECVQQLGAITKEGYALSQGTTIAQVKTELDAGSVTTANNADGECTYETSVTDDIFNALATGAPDKDLDGKTLAACVNTTTGKRDVQTAFDVAANCAAEEGDDG
ncbi:prepilin-type N-terminal cleavage/methylation domain protein [Synechococcus sp. PROS-7-1]|uniref:type IV pilin protein n=1 Tax=Synechococcus sp. PROS-7-1 TaxID=1442556 RepID=UPI001645D6B2|nr:type II secretion system protein [Synechococcus sp. PROS-7-1]QNI85827.1 prepilin-type N-terminal cleavage/methylation domain protein [Synechococcus sp. PROS-7-1]